MRNNENLEPIKIEGKMYFTVKQFAIKTCHSEQSIRRLITKGNKIRCLKADKFADKPFIPVEEFINYPFLLPGRGDEVYYYGTE